MPGWSSGRSPSGSNVDLVDLGPGEERHRDQEDDPEQQQRPAASGAGTAAADAAATRRAAGPGGGAPGGGSAGGAAGLRRRGRTGAAAAGTPASPGSRPGAAARGTARVASGSVGRTRRPCAVEPVVLGRPVLGTAVSPGTISHGADATVRAMPPDNLRPSTPVRRGRRLASRMAMDSMNKVIHAAVGETWLGSADRPGRGHRGDRDARPTSAVPGATCATSWAPPRPGGHHPVPGRGAPRRRPGLVEALEAEHQAMAGRSDEIERRCARTPPARPSPDAADAAAVRRGRSWWTSTSRTRRRSSSRDARRTSRRRSGRPRCASCASSPPRQAGWFFAWVEDGAADEAPRPTSAPRSRRRSGCVFGRVLGRGYHRTDRAGLDARPRPDSVRISGASLPGCDACDW